MSVIKSVIVFAVAFVVFVFIRSEIVGSRNLRRLLNHADNVNIKRLELDGWSDPDEHVDICITNNPDLRFLTTAFQHSFHAPILGKYLDGKIWFDDHTSHLIIAFLDPKLNYVVIAEEDYMKFFDPNEDEYYVVGLTNMPGDLRTNLGSFFGPAEHQFHPSTNR